MLINRWVNRRDGDLSPNTKLLAIIPNFIICYKIPKCTIWLITIISITITIISIIAIAISIIFNFKENTLFWLNWVWITVSDITYILLLNYNKQYYILGSFNREFKSIVIQ